MLEGILLNFFLMNDANVILLSVIPFSVILLEGILLNLFLMNVEPNAILLSAIQLNVIVPEEPHQS